MLKTLIIATALLPTLATVGGLKRLRGDQQK